MTGILSIIDSESELNETGPFSEGLFRALVAPYTVPTTIRKLKNKKYKIDFLKKHEKIKYYLGVGTGSLIDLTCAGGYSLMAFNYDLPELAFLPLATNVLSGIYELSRLGINKLKNKPSKKNIEEVF